MNSLIQGVPLLCFVSIVTCLRVSLVSLAVRPPPLPLQLAPRVFEFRE
jgi:hypothetical protein